MKSQQIRIRTEDGNKNLTISGWLSDGNRSYIWIGTSGGEYLGTLGGYPLYRLAKAIVKRWESRVGSKDGR